MRYFFSDTHFFETRLGINGKPNLFYRPFSSVESQDTTMLGLILNTINDGDEVYCLGDVMVDDNAEMYLDALRKALPNSKFYLIIGNYDENRLELLKRYFDYVYEDMIIEIDDKKIYLNHYPIKCKRYMELNSDISFSITGHIHSLWKVQPKMVNVSVDAWHFKPVSEDEIKFVMNACEKYYDENVFPYVSK